MFRFWRPRETTAARLQAGAAAAALLLGLGAAAQAVTVTGDPEFFYNGVNDVEPSVFTVDPFNDPLVTRANNRGITEDRMLRQTFKNPTTINVGEIVIAFDVTGGSTMGSPADTGLGLRIYEVDDVLSGTWTPLGLPVAEILFTDTLPASSESLSFVLSEGEVFELPARFEGTTGYGIEVSTPFALYTDGNPGVLWFANNDDGTDFYADGRYYTESGNASNSNRDVGLSLIGTEANPCIDGDTNCDNMVDVEIDLAAIADHFRQNVELREDGDLTGNGFVDFDDFDKWKLNYPFPLEGIDFSFLAVPEPGAASVLTLAILAGAGIGRRSRRGAA